LKLLKSLNTISCHALQSRQQSKLLMSLSPILLFRDTKRQSCCIAWVLLLGKTLNGSVYTGVALGFPEPGIPLGSAINLLSMDVILMFFLCAALWTPPLVQDSEKYDVANGPSCRLFLFGRGKIVRREWCRLSMNDKNAGCAALVFTLPKLIQTSSDFNSSLWVHVGGIALLAQIIVRWALCPRYSSRIFRNSRLRLRSKPGTQTQLVRAATLLLFAASTWWIVFPNRS